MKTPKIGSRARPRSSLTTWIFKLEEDFIFQSTILGHTFSGEWLKLSPDGTITVPKGYAWDGCTIKISILDLFIIGTPDGIIDIETMKPKTYYASLIHDALYQYYGWHGISRKTMDDNFYAMMKEKKFIPAPVYWLFVRVLGSLFFLGQKVVRTPEGKEFFQKACSQNANILP